MKYMSDNKAFFIQLRDNITITLYYTLHISELDIHGEVPHALPW